MHVNEDRTKKNYNNFRKNSKNSRDINSRKQDDLMPTLKLIYKKVLGPLVDIAPKGSPPHKMWKISTCRNIRILN